MEMNWLRKLPKPVLILGWLLVVVACVAALQNTDNGYQKEIKQTIHQKGGEVVGMELRSWDIGPFKNRAKNQRIYHVTYKLGGVEKVVWVKKGPGKDNWIWS
jgi:hypothetical protein